MDSVIPQFDAACRILRVLRASGYEAYLAGGCVRDLLLGRQPKDFDVATSAEPQKVLRLFPRTFAVGAKFGVVLVAEADAAQPAETNFVTEVATFRSDGIYTDGRRPDTVRYTASAAEDVQRRDFTVNGLLLDPLPLCECPFAEWTPERLYPHIVDSVGGVADLQAGIVRAIGNAEQRFEEDHLRMLRGVRFAARMGFTLEKGTEAAIRRLAAKSALVSRERVRDELTKMLTEGQARHAFELLDETGLMVEVLPEVARMKGVEHPPQFHPEGDVWQHTLKALQQLKAGGSMTLAWGVLLHDVGKPSTFRRADRIRFDGHADVGVAIAAEICRRFRFSREETGQILALVENHMRFMDAPRMKAATLKRFFRLDRFEEHLELHRVDCMASKGGLETWNMVRERWQSMPQEAVRPKPLITGRELISQGYLPGASFKAMLHTAEEAQLEGKIHSAEEALALVREHFGAPPAEQALIQQVRPQ